MDKSQQISFLKRYAANQHSPEEHTNFLEWFHTLSEEDASAVMDLYASVVSSAEHPIPVDKQLLQNRIEQDLDYTDGVLIETSKGIGINWSRIWRFASAAIILCIMGLGYFIYRKSQNEPQLDHRTALTEDILPGGNRAVLTLGDGSKIVLNDAEAGEIARQEGVQISKIADGQLRYAAVSSAEKLEKAFINEIRTPKAGQYRIELSDGTKVWLNSASSIRFPASFDNRARKVEITGEVYFEVAGRYHSGKKVPFQVYSKRQKIEVLGTHFNIQSYEDETAIRTTLLEGSVRVTTLAAEKGMSADSVLLKPGEQAIYRTQLGPISVQKVDAEAAVAWKTGYFKFKDTEIQEVMRQLARWYDLEVAYIGTLPQDQFTGYISKNVAISQVLNILEEGGGVRFSLQGKQVEVYNKY
ncbi:FecR family protein [Dyadobacter tibetensis]|uniref:FecR family protein n=1 Tax=Dyadobacter tibetensis TaxID=1211851 RepID=UPI000472E1B7|nr:FecR family protein [Dyadobacter tibetensis]